MEQIYDPGFDFTQIKDPMVQEQLRKLQQLGGITNLNEILHQALKQHKSQSDNQDIMLQEDLHFYMQNTDITQQITYKQFQIFIQNHNFIQDENIKSIDFPKIIISPLEMIKYSVIELEQMVKDKQYSYQFLTVKVVSQCARDIKSKNIHLLIQDLQNKNNRVIRVEIQDSQDQLRLSFFQQDQQFIILDPFYKFSMEFEFFIYVNEVKNILFCQKDENPLIKIQELQKQLKKSCLELKNEGNEEYQKNQFQAALNLYNYALNNPDKTLDDNLRMILHGNISQVYNQFNDKLFQSQSFYHINQAIDLCEKINDSQKQSQLQKFIYRKAFAFQLNKETIKESLKCIKHLEQSIQNQKIDKAQEKQIKDLKTKIQIKIKQMDGDYDVLQIFKDQDNYSIEKQQNQDILEYIGPIKIEMTKDGRGRGLFASRDIKQGEFLLVEQAFASSYDCQLSDNQKLELAILFKTENDETVEAAFNLIKKMRSSKIYSAQALNLCCDGENDNKVLIHDIYQLSQQNLSNQMIDKYQMLEHPCVFTANQAFNIIKKNQFDAIDWKQSIIGSINENLKSEKSVNTLYLLTSFLNHSCLSNSQYIFIGNFAFVLAQEDIKENQEILGSYVVPTKLLKDRREVFRKFGFICKCRLCLNEIVLEQMYGINSGNSKILPAYNNKFEQPQIAIDEFIKYSEIFKDEMQNCKGYINEMYYLGKQALIAKIILFGQMSKKKWDNKELTQLYFQIFNPVDQIIQYWNRLTEMKFFYDFSKQHMKKNVEWLNFLKNQLKLQVTQKLSGKPNNELVEYIINMQI